MRMRLMELMAEALVGIESLNAAECYLGARIGAIIACAINRPRVSLMADIIERMPDAITDNRMQPWLAASIAMQAPSSDEIEQIMSNWQHTDARLRELVLRSAPEDIAGLWLE